ncbi:MAG: hypothetical protein JWM12_3628, partial [Ilumatobacteraceae bacterium]|nr:hypothetical protein [Ilumatobacteraceae bacterium]
MSRTTDARPRPGRRARRIPAVLGCVVVLAACGISTDDAPRDIAAPARAENAGDNGQT